VPTNGTCGCTNLDFRTVGLATAQETVLTNTTQGLSFILTRVKIESCHQRYLVDHSSSAPELLIVVRSAMECYGVLLVPMTGTEINPIHPEGPVFQTCHPAEGA
jgi:hypothetical protein